MPTDMKVTGIKWMVGVASAAVAGITMQQVATFLAASVSVVAFISFCFDIRKKYRDRNKP